MFGFIYTKKRVSDEISVAINNTFRACFINKDFITKVPRNFWQDEYIAGFIFVLISLFLKFQFKGDFFSERKRGEIVNLTLMKICGEFWRDILNIGSSNMNKESPLYKKGGDEASLMYFAIAGTLNLESSNPLIKQAQLLAKNRQKIFLESAKLSNIKIKNVDQFTLHLAITELTIAKHINENYLQESDEVNQSDSEKNEAIELVEKHLKRMGYDLLPHGFGVAWISLESGYSPAETASHIAFTTMALDVKESKDDIDKLAFLACRGLNILLLLKEFKDSGEMHPAQWQNDSNALFHIVNIDKDQLDWVNTILADPISGKERLAVSMA
jgi:hypothetical protein